MRVLCRPSLTIQESYCWTQEDNATLDKGWKLALQRHIGNGFRPSLTNVLVPSADVQLSNLVRCQVIEYIAELLDC
ncbi:MAG TPA: hypothetical protein DDZ62_13315 [Delftia acidovorans]|nr:hypothetical protein [Delftia acidovorans]